MPLMLDPLFLPGGLIPPRASRTKSTDRMRASQSDSRRPASALSLSFVSPLRGGGSGLPKAAAGPSSVQVFFGRNRSDSVAARPRTAHTGQPQVRSASQSVPSSPAAGSSRSFSESTFGWALQGEFRQRTTSVGGESLRREVAESSPKGPAAAKTLAPLNLRERSVTKGQELVTSPKAAALRPSTAHSFGSSAAGGHGSSLGPSPYDFLVRTQAPSFSAMHNRRSAL